MSGLKILIVGASIAGPTAAYWFAKAGAEVTIIERFPHLRANGQNVDIRTAGVTVMRKMTGVEAAVRDKIVPMEGINFVRADGRPFGTIRPTRNPDQQSLISEYEIYRGDLAQILYSLTKDNENITYVFGEQVTSIQQHERENGPITVEFTNGFPTTKFDLVVACDGANSRTRAIGFGCGVRDYIKSENWWIAYYSIQRDLLEESKMGQSYSAPGGRFFGIGPDPSGANRVAVMGIYPRDDHDAMRPFRDAVERGNDALKQFVSQYYKGAGWKCDEAMKGLMEAEDFYASEVVQVKPPSLYKGRFVLVGDAGYAPGPTGGGTSLAITGAYVLAGEIGRHKGDLPAALRGYEEQMRPIINDLQKIPPFIRPILAPQTAWGLWLRNTILGFVLSTKIFEFAQKFFAESFANADKYRLPDYEWVA